MKLGPILKEALKGRVVPAAGRPTPRPVVATFGAAVAAAAKHHYAHNRYTKPVR